MYTVTLLLYITTFERILFHHQSLIMMMAGGIVVQCSYSPGRTPQLYLTEAAYISISVQENKNGTRQCSDIVF